MDETDERNIHRRRPQSVGGYGMRVTEGRMVKDGYPLAYAEGFDDGCHSGNKAGGSLFDEFRKDVSRFARENQYAQEWSDGFRQCESQQEATQRQMRIAVEQQKLVEQRKASEREAQYHLEHQVLKGVDTTNFKYLK